jgi:Stress responsive A/B Barrel Domain
MPERIGAPAMKKMYHIVLVKFAPQKAHRMTPLFAALDGLRKILPGFLTCTGGPYSSPEGLNQGYTHGLVMTFSDGAARDQYLSHPEHEKVKQAFLPDLEGVVAFDFEGD